MDIDMPVKNGYETTQDILQYFDSHFTPPPTISACTAFVSESEKLRAKQSGMKYYLTKPINSALIENILIKNFLK